MANQSRSVNPCDQIEGIEELFWTSGKVVTVKRVRDCPFDACQADVKPHAVDYGYAVGRFEATWRPDELACKVERFEHAWFAVCNNLDDVSFRVGAAMYLKC